MTSRAAAEGRRVWLEPAPLEPYRYQGGGRIKVFEERLPVLQGFDEAQRLSLAAQALPGESWEQLLARLEQERRAEFKASLTPCRTCGLIEHYQTRACQQMGICDACNTALEAELASDPAPDL